MPQIIESLTRYLGGIFVAASIAILISLIGANAFDFDLLTLLSGTSFVGLPSASIVFVAAATGIYFGNLLLGCDRKILKCAILTVMLVMMYQVCWYADWQYKIGKPKHGKGSLAPVIALAGISVSVFIFASTVRRNRIQHFPVAEKV